MHKNFSMIEKIANDLVEIGRQQAILLCAPPASEVELRKKIDELLIHRKIYEAAMRDIITKSELANLILAHFQTLICKEAGVAEPPELIDYEELSKKIIKIVYWWTLGLYIRKSGTSKFLNIKNVLKLSIHE